jgi:hypothetical protein
LDYAVARYFNKQTARFATPDPLLTSGRTQAPQTWNRYIYTLNNPLKFTDPLGLYEFDSSVDDTQRDNFRKNLKQAKERLKDIEKFYKKNSEEYKNAKAAIDAFGCESGKGGCKDNRVVIATKTFTNGAAAETTMIDNKTRVLVTIDSSQLTKDTGIGADGKTSVPQNLVDEIVHEGVHAVDYINFMDNKVKTDDYNFERRGYVVASAMVGVVQGGANVEFTDKSQLPIYQESWKTANPSLSQVDSLRKERNQAIDKVIAVPQSNGGYGFSKGNPTYNYTQ